MNLNSMPVWPTEWFPGQSGLYRQTLSRVSGWTDGWMDGYSVCPNSFLQDVTKIQSLIYQITVKDVPAQCLLPTPAVQEEANNTGSQAPSSGWLSRVLTIQGVKSRYSRHCRKASKHQAHTSSVPKRQRNCSTHTIFKDLLWS